MTEPTLPSHEPDLYQDIFRHVDVGLLVYRLEDADDPASLRLISANPAATRLGVLGHSFEQELGRTIFEMFPHLQDTGRAEIYAEVARTGTTRRLPSVRVNDDTAAEHIFSVKAFPLPDRCVGLSFDDITDVQYAEHEARATEDRLRQVLENMPVMLTAFRGDRLVVWNRECEIVTGYEAAEMVEHPNTNIGALLYPDTQTLANVREVMTTNHSYRNLEMPITCKDGGKRIISWSDISGDFPVPGWDYWAIGVDITEHRSNQDRLTRLQIITAALSEAVTPAEVIEVILDASITDFGGERLGMALISADGESLEMFIRDEVIQRYGQRFLDIPLTAKMPITDAIRDKTSVWIADLVTYRQLYPDLASETGSPALAALPMIAEGKPIGAVGVSFSRPQPFDARQKAFITALTQQCTQAMIRAQVYQREAEARQLTEGANRRIALLQSVTSGLSSAVTASEVAEVIVGRALEVLGGHLGGVVKVTEDGQYVEIIRVSGMPDHVYETLRKVPITQPGAITDAVRTGQPIWIESPEDYVKQYPNIAPYMIERTNTQATACFPLVIGGHITGAIAFNFPTPRRFDLAERSLLAALAEQCAQALERADIYEQESRARQAAEQANELKMKFLAMISHELRTPLASIKGFATTLLADDVTFTTAEQREFTEIINQESNRLTDLIEQLLDLSRLQAGTLGINPGPQSFDTILGMIHYQLQMLAIGHHLTFELGEDLPPVVADPKRIGQVLTNLVGNATRYSPHGTTICVAAQRSENWVRVDISDAGAGIPEDQREKVFEVFWQAKRGEERSQEGAGLGLAICRGLIEAHGGRIWVKETGETGTTISFTLPLA